MTPLCHSLFKEAIISKIFPTKFPENLLHLPTSAYCHQDKVLRIQAARLLPEHLRHIPIREWFSILLLLYCSLSAKSNLHKCIHQCCYDGYYMLRKSHSFYLSSFHCFLKAFQSVYQFRYVLCYNVLYDFVSLIFSLIRICDAL